MKRNAIILDRNLTIGQVGNVAAILMGQISKIDPSTFSGDEILDKDGVRHAGIKNSTVLLKGGSGQISKLAQQLSGDETVTNVVFTAKGQSLNNRFEDYETIIMNNTLEMLKPVGIALSGEDELIRGLTKKFSLLH